ncbi:MAG: serine hydrolase domain-containing protein [Saprospiraceae bacterium]
MKKLFFLLVLCFIKHAGTSQSWQDTVMLIEKAFERYKQTNPGAQLAISRNGNIIFSNAWGMADLEHHVSLTKESVIEAGSVSKQFTAAAMLLLEQQGKLSMGDDVRKYIPELRNYGTVITLRHMMQHTSGIKDWGSIAGIAGWPRTTKTYSNDDALLIISRQKTLNNKPGDEYIYSNSNYNLFAIIVERVSGMSLAEFTSIHIFEPAGMKHTEWRNDFKKIVLNRAIAYSKNGDAYFTDMPNEYVYGNGGLLTTAEDLVAWNNYYLNGKLGNPSLLPRQLSTTPFNNGKLHTYGAGLVIDSTRGWRSITHSGATAAYRSYLQHYPDLGLTIAWLSNTSEFDNGPNVTNAIRDLFVKNMVMMNKKSEIAPISISNKKLQIYAGWYRNIKTADGLKLTVRNDSVFVRDGRSLTPIAENVFMMGANRLEIRNTVPRKIIVILPTDTLYYIKADTATTSMKSMNEYIGTYWSEEAEATYSILVKDGKLIAHQDPKTDMSLSPMYKDGFNTSGAVIYFERDKSRRISSLKVYVGRARNVVFKKINH